MRVNLCIFACKRAQDYNSPKKKESTSCLGGCFWTQLCGCFRVGYKWEWVGEFLTLKHVKIPRKRSQWKKTGNIHRNILATWINGGSVNFDETTILGPLSSLSLDTRNPQSLCSVSGIFPNCWAHLWIVNFFQNAIRSFWHKFSIKRHQNWVNLKRTVIPPTGSVYHLVCEASQVCKRIISKRPRPIFSISEKTSSFYLHKNDQPKMEQARLPPFASKAPQEAMLENIRGNFPFSHLR